MTIGAMLERALAAHRAGRMAEAQALYDEILQLQPGHFDALHLSGLIAWQRKDFARSVTLMSEAVAIEPRRAAVHTNLGMAYKDLGRLDDALASYDRAIALEPGLAEAHINRGNVLQLLMRPEQALASYDRAIEVNPHAAIAHNNRGGVLDSLGRHSEALASYERAVAAQPDYAEAHCNLAVTLRLLGRLEEALEHFDRALALRTNYANAYDGRGVTLGALGRPLQALESSDRAVALAPDRSSVHCNRGMALAALGRTDEAIESYARAIRLDPGNANAHLNRGLRQLARGEFEDGWKGYERRWQANNWDSVEVRVDAPLWDGKRVPGTLVAWAEQGVGDQILFCGMLQELAALAGRLVVPVDVRLVPLLRRSFGNIEFVPVNGLSATERFDAQVPLGSIGQFLRRGWSDIPAGRRAYLRADPARATRLRAALREGAKLVCGISWRSVTRVAGHGESKSITLPDLLPLLSMPELVAVNLQYGAVGAELAQLKTEAGIEVRQLRDIDNFNDIDGLAALIEACDVVVTVSNTTAHLAGALGKRTLLVLPNGAGLKWYWHEARDDSPWYPSLRLFRCRRDAPWGSVVEEVCNALRQFEPRD